MIKFYQIKKVSKYSLNDHKHYHHSSLFFFSFQATASSLPRKAIFSIYSVVPQTGQKLLFFACLELLGCVSGGIYFPLLSSGANYSILAILVF